MALHHPSDETAHRVADMAARLGIPDAELTENVRNALAHVLREGDDLRQAVETTRLRMTELEHLADADGLTPLLNRRAFVRELSRLVAFSQRYGVPSSLVYLDLNNFKAVNDTFGHAAGDAVLIHVATLLSNEVRGSDVIARLGGDEFGIILSHTDEHTARAKAEALLRSIETKPCHWQGNSILLRAAYGIYVFRPDSDASQILAEADRCMYLSKSGRNPAHAD